ncbi:cytochrome P450 [Mycena polygramma]|nr:cytochrome P450 [Mycena polygramma]
MAEATIEPFGVLLLHWRSILIALFTFPIYSYIRKNRSPSLPPGPRGLPLIGNVLDIPTVAQWLTFAELGDVWGDIMCLTALGQTLIVVNSNKVAEDLLESHGATLSDRPMIPFGGVLCGFDNTLVLAQYGDRVRKERKLFHRLFGTPASIKQFAPLLSGEVHKLLRNIAANPDRFLNEIKRMTAGIMLRIAYGYDLRDGPEPDPFLKMYETTADNFTVAASGFLVDGVPLLRYWPEWLPGGGFHTTAKLFSKQIHGTVDTLFDYVKKQMAAGTAETSLLSTLLDEKTHEEYLMKWAGASMEVGGSDTTSAELEAFFLAMTLYPDVQAAAQEELDRVVGSDRLPEMSDRAELPYIDAVCKELLRWHVVAPLGVPHRTRHDFIYDRGGGSKPVLIPKNSMVIPNAWKMAHDPACYANPMAFNPRRFLAAEGMEPEPDPARFVFGYGRRICPGKLMADETIFRTCSAVLSVFNISKVRKDDVFMEPRVGQTSEAVSHPLPFDCVVEPRSTRALELIYGG